MTHGQSGITLLWLATWSALCHGTSEQRIRAVIFDVSGTLIRIKKLHAEQCDNVCKRFPVCVQAFEHQWQEEYKRKKDKSPLQQTDEDIFERILTNLKLSKNRVEEAIDAFYEPKLSNMEIYDIESLVQCVYTLRNKVKDIKLGICSNSRSRRTVNKVLSVLKGRGVWFDRVVVSCDGERYRKPAPEIFHSFPATWGIPRGQILMVGDQENDVDGAAASGMQCVVMRHVPAKGTGATPQGGMQQIIQEARTRLNAHVISTWADLCPIVLGRRPASSDRLAEAQGGPSNKQRLQAEE